MTKLKSIEDRADLRSKNKIRKGAGQEECLCKESIRFCGVLVKRERGKVSKLCSIYNKKAKMQN